MSAQFWRVQRQEFLRGRTTALLEMREPLDEALRRQPGLFGDEDEQLLAAAIVADLHQTMIDRARAVGLLSPYLRTKGQRVHVDARACERLRSRDPFIAGVVLRQIANLCFRFDANEEGIRWAQQAESHLCRLDDPEALLARSENRIWWARMEWRLERYDQARSQLEDLVLTLPYAAEAEPAEGVGDGVRRILGIATNLLAHIDFTSGNTARARQHIATSVGHLVPERIDAIRLAFSLHEAGVVEASLGAAFRQRAERYLQRAERLFRRYRHPWAYRSANEFVRCAVRRDDTVEATRRFDLVENDPNAPMISDGRERSRAAGERLVTEILLAERTRAWATCNKLAQRILKLPDLPTGLRLQAQFHQTRSALHLTTERDFKKAVGEMKKLRDGMVGRRRIRLVVACGLALAEALIDGDPVAAARFFQTAEQDRRAAGAESSYLSEWASRLRPHVLAPMTTFFDQKWKVARAEFSKQYNSYNWKMAEKANPEHPDAEFQRRTDYKSEQMRMARAQLKILPPRKRNAGRSALTVKSKKPTSVPKVPFGAGDDRIDVPPSLDLLATPERTGG